MKVGITADIHLKTRTETPERFNALENIFQQLRENKISYLFIAGDLFDKECYNYRDFEELCAKYSDIRLKIIPGNHDSQIEQKYFSVDNIEIIQKPSIEKIDEVSFLFIPYKSIKSMDEVLTEFFSKNEKPEKWVLIGHGDYIAKERESNPYEEGLYMPISATIINKYNPLKVILGHIHKPSEFGRVIYPGSPHGLDINETGKRRFIIYDTEENNIKTLYVKTDKIYFVSSIVTFPFENEEELLEKRIDELIESWELSPEELNKVELRLEVKGWTNNKDQLKNTIINILQKKGISLYKSDKPDDSIKEVNVVKEINDIKISILKKVKEKIDSLQLQNFHTSKDKIMEKAMKLIILGKWEEL